MEIKSEIKLENVKKSYYLSNGDEIQVLKGIDLDIKKGEFVALMGESGCGKTTLLNIIGCLHYLSSGKYYLGGENIGEVRDDYALAFIRNKKMGFIFQQFNLFSRLTSLKNVSMPSLYLGVSKKTREAKAVKIFESLGLVLKDFPENTFISSGSLLLQCWQIIASSRISSAQNGHFFILF